VTIVQAGITEDRVPALSEMVHLLMPSSASPPDLIAIHPGDGPLWPARLAGDHRWAVYDPATRELAEVDPRHDTALPGLADWINQAELVSYRPGERATLRWRQGNGVQYIKVVKPQQSARLIKHWLRMANLADDALGMPHLECFDHTRGWLGFTMVSGSTLHHVLSQNQGASQAVGTAGAAIADLQSLPADDLPRRNHDVARLCRHVHDHDPNPDFETHQIIDQALEELPQLTHTTSVLVHGDLHDKNLLVASPPALLNLNTLRSGSAAEDVGNLAAHLMLRGLQDIDTDGLVPTLIAAYGESGGKASPAEIHIETRRSLVRLACVFRFRPPWSHLSTPLARLAMENG